MGKGGVYPITSAAEIDPNVSQEIQTVLQELYQKPKVKTNDELQARITEYFNICRRTKIRPGFSTLALSLGVSRSTFWRWCKGDGCDRERQEIAEQAREFIEAYLEAAFMSGSINPIPGVFLLKIGAVIRTLSKLRRYRLSIH